MAQLGNFGACSSDEKGTGTLSTCDIKKYGDPKGIVLFKKLWSYDIDVTGNVDLDLASYTNDVKSFKAQPLLGSYNFEQNTPENEKNTDSTGVLSKVRDGKPQFSFSFDKGGCFHKALYSKAGQSKWDLGIVFTTGILLAKNIDETKLVGFDMGMFDVETYKLLQGTDREGGMAMLQLLDALEFNTRHEFLEFKDFGDLLSVNGIVDLDITLSPIVAGATEVRAKMTSSCNKGNVILGLDEVTNFVLLGSQASATTISGVSIDANTKEYIFELNNPTVATDTIQIQINDGTYTVIEDVDGNLFKGTSNIVTVA